MKYLYLDHNVYIEALKNDALKESLLGLADKGIQCLYSPAHIEEIYNVKANKESKFRNKMDDLINLISMVTSNTEVLPQFDGLILKHEDPKKCYTRVKGIDTRSMVENDSYIKYIFDTENFKNLLKLDKHISSLSNIEPDKIWKEPVVSEYIHGLNAHIDRIIERNNMSVDQLILWLVDNSSYLNVYYNILDFNSFEENKKLPPDFCFQQGNYPILKESHAQLEFTIEILFRVLNYSGYNSEKKEKTAISGTHDVTHAIYATKSDVLISTDQRFVKKCKAVYAFLGVPTEVTCCEQGDLVDTVSKLT